MMGGLPCRLAACLVAAAVWALGCGGEGGGPSLAPDDAGADAGVDGSRQDAVSESATQDGAPDGPENCSFDIEPSGGAMEACGLRLSVPPGAVGGITTIRVGSQPVDAQAPDGLAAESRAITLDTSAQDFSFQRYVVVHFPQDTGETTVWASKYFPDYGAWGVLETCFRDTQWAGVRTTSLGTYTALTDVVGNDLPGSGHADVTWTGQDGTFDYTGVGYAHYIPEASGARSFELYGVRDANGSYETFKVSFALPPDGAPKGALVSLMVGGSEWVNYDGITPPSPVVLSVSEPAPNHVIGTMSATLFRFADPDWEPMDITATIDATATRHFWPSEDPCPVP